MRRLVFSVTAFTKAICLFLVDVRGSPGFGLIETDSLLLKSKCSHIIIFNRFAS